MNDDTLPLGCIVDLDDDGDWVIIPPPDVTIFSAPGEGVLLLGAAPDGTRMSREQALEEAREYLGVAEGTTR